jgi:hypothetical protein
VSKLAQLIAKEEGFGIPGTVPTRDDNPGDLRHSPHSVHAANAPDAIGVIDSVADGWADLERQLHLFAERGLSLQEAIYEFAPPSENNSARYLAYVCEGLQCTAGTSVVDALKIQ